MQLQFINQNFNRDSPMLKNTIFTDTQI